MAVPPEFSIIIPSRNRMEPLRRCLASLARLEAPADGFEVIVADDGSEPPYAPAVGEFQGALRLRLIRCDGQGPGQARNAAAAVASGRFLAFTDDDCEPQPDWLTCLGSLLRRQPDALAGGRTVNELTENLCSTASQVLISYLYDYYDDGNHETRFFTSCNFALSAGLYREIGGFDARFRLAGGEDRDFCDRWAKSGKPLVYIRDAVVRHSHRLSLPGFLRQHFTYGRGAWHFHKARAERGSGPVPIEPLSFLSGMLASPFKDKSVRSPFVVSPLIGSTVIMIAFGYFYERWSSGKSG